MTEGRVALSVLDLVPVAEGESAADAVRNSIDLAQRAEALGYRRYWFAEHHLNPGVAGTTPAVMVALTAAATSTIRVGSGGVQTGHRTPLSVVEEFGLLDCAYPGRLDLGLGRTLGRPRPEPDGAPQAARPHTSRPKPEARVVDGVLIPSPPSLRRVFRSPRAAMTRMLLQQPEAITPTYTEQIEEILGLLDGTYRSETGLAAHVTPGEGAGVQVWILGSSAGESAEVAGHRGLRFAANYHVSPATILEAIDAYRAAFKPSPDLDAPYVCVSVDAVVGDSDEHAQTLAAGYGLWVLGIRTGEGAVPYPSAATAAAHNWTEEEHGLVVDRVRTQVVGSPATVAAQLERIGAVTGADELVVTTMTHDHADRVRSYELLARAWFES